MVHHNRWSENKKIDAEAVRATWLKRVARIRRAGAPVDYIMEKSPPNMMRHRLIAGLFSECRLVCNTRNPYANVASMAFRYTDYAEQDESGRREICERIARKWVRCAGKIRQIVQEEGCPLLTYEQFCEEPQAIFRAFGFDHAVLSRVSTERAVKVKDHAVQTITNMNQRQIARLDDASIEAVRAVIAPHGDLLDFFGYAEDPARAQA
ncbi:MAG: hypothetical protein Kow0013_21780 [Pararhodobacter sp.]